MYVQIVEQVLVLEIGAYRIMYQACTTKHIVFKQYFTVNLPGVIHGIHKVIYRVFNWFYTGYLQDIYGVTQRVLARQHIGYLYVTYRVKI